MALHDSKKIWIAPHDCQCKSAQSARNILRKSYEVVSLLFNASEPLPIDLSPRLDLFVVSLCCQLCQIGAVPDRGECRGNAQGSHLKMATDFVFFHCLSQFVEILVALFYLRPELLTLYEQRLVHLRMSFQEFLSVSVPDHQRPWSASIGKDPKTTATYQ